ncbi:hypothetical protein E2320_001122 [Naja naja]|nr:hypothetical protein E2320_001122 [Naja naja]
MRMDACEPVRHSPNRKKAYFLSFREPPLFDTATAIAPQTVKAVSWEELQEVLGNHYAPKPSRDARRHASQRTKLKTNLSVSMWQLSAQLPFTVGVRDLRSTKALLAKADLTLKQGIEEAQAAELSSASAAAIQKAINLPGSKPSTAINYEDAAYEDEYLEEEEEVNRLRTPRLQFRNDLSQLWRKSFKNHLSFQKRSLPQLPKEGSSGKNLPIT